MTLTDFFEAIGKIAALLFVVSSMLAMGLSLTIPQIIQPLKNVRLVIPLEQSLKAGLSVLSTAAGAPVK